jgi:hypothetical protein
MRRKSELGTKKPRSQFERMLAEVARGSEIERMFSAISGYHEKKRR